MIITVNSIGDSVANSKGKGKPWYSVEVTYKNDKGMDGKRKFMSFDESWELMKKLEVGKTYDVKVEKDGNYWKWTSVEETTADAVSSGGGGARKGTTNWDERLQFDRDKQPLIIRQSVLSTAVAYFGLHDEKPTPEQVVEVAKMFEDYVNSRPAMEEMEVE